MSIRVTSRVWENSVQKGSALLLLLALADQANDHGVCWPSVGSLAHKTRLSEREVQYLVTRLCASGELAVIPGGGRRRTTVYEIRVQGLHSLGTGERPNGADSAPFKGSGEERVQNGAGKGAKSEERVQSSAGKGAKSGVKGEAGCTRTVLTVTESSEEPYEPLRARSRARQEKPSTSWRVPDDQRMDIEAYIAQTDKEPGS